MDLKAEDVIAGFISFNIYQDNDYDGEAERQAKALLRRLEDFGFEIVRKQQ